jgi:4-hydroxybenzoyl-CoA thioesterase
MVDTRARFLAPSKFGDDIVIESCITEWRRSSFDVQHKVFKGDVLAVECSETRVWAVRSKSDPEAIEGQSVPQDVLARFGAPQRE